MSSTIQEQLKSNIQLTDDEILAGAPGKVKPTMYSLWYRENTNPHPLYKFFFHEGNLQSAIARGKVHCERMGQRFIFVRPFLSDLNADERRHFGTSD